MKLPDNQNKRLLSLNLINLDVPKSMCPVVTTTHNIPGAELIVYLFSEGYIPSPNLFSDFSNLTRSEETDILDYYSDMIPVADTFSTSNQKGVKIVNGKIFNYTNNTIETLYKEIKKYIACYWCGKEWPVENPWLTINTDASEFKFLNTANTNDEILNYLYYSVPKLSMKDSELIETLVVNSTSINDIYPYYEENDPANNLKFYLICLAMLKKQIHVEDSDIGYEDYIEFLKVMLEHKIKLSRTARQSLAVNVYHCYQELIDDKAESLELLKVLTKVYFIHHLQDYWQHKWDNPFK